MVAMVTLSLLQVNQILIAILSHCQTLKQSNWSEEEGKKKVLLDEFAESKQIEWNK